MKTNILFCCAISAFLAAPVFAEEVLDVQKMADTLKAELKLSPEQVEDIKPILKEYRAELKDARRDKENDLEEVLTEEQMDKYRSMKEEITSKVEK